MTVKKATKEDLKNFSNWCCQHGKIEERTCRPVVNGKKVPTSPQFSTLSFFIDGRDEPIGKFTYFDNNTRNRSCEFGYTIDPKYKNKGLGTKMIDACITYLFNDKDLNLNKLYCQTAEFNKPSVGVLKKLNLHKDATLREHHELNGKLWDDFIYSVLRSEWNNKTNKI